MRIRTMTLDDYDTVLDLMQATEGITVREADSRPAIARYLARNPGLSFVAEHNDMDGIDVDIRSRDIQQPKATIAGCLLAGHDGRRGYLNHLIVQPANRRSGIATALV